MELTVSVVGPGPSQCAFVGMGSAIPDPNYFTEPHTSIYFRLFPNDFLEGSLGLTVSSQAANGRPGGEGHVERIVSRAPHPGVGVHRVQLRKIGNLLTFNCDVDYRGGSFVADYSVSRRLDTELAFLNESNSRLFFGVQGANTTFDDLSVRFLPTLSIEVTEVALCWESNPNVVYQVEYRSEVSGNVWVPLGGQVIGNGATTCIFDAVQDLPRRYYRVLEVP